MSDKNDGWESRPSVFESIEAELEKSLSKKREEIENELKERIHREREEAQKRVEAAETEISEVKRILEESRAVLVDFNRDRERIHGLIDGLFRLAVEGRRAVARSAGEAEEALTKIGELAQELESARARSQERTAFLKMHLEKKFGIKTRLERAFDVEEPPCDWRSEVLKMRHVREVVGVVDEGPVEGEAPAVTGVKEGQGTAGNSAPNIVFGAHAEPGMGEAGRDDRPSGKGATEGEGREPQEVKVGSEQTFALDPRAGLGKAERTIADSAASPEPEPASGPEPMTAPEPFEAETGEREAAPRQDAVEEKKEPFHEAPVTGRETESGAEVEALRETLAGLRKTETIAGGNDLVYFEKSGKMVLDAESLITAMGRLAENAKELHEQLGKTASLKDLFFIKQEILNQQEILRKVFYRAVKFCEKEDGALPEYLGDIISTATLKDALERLTMGNWSNDDDFGAFMEEIALLKCAFVARTSSPAAYLCSLLDQLA